MNPFDLITAPLKGTNLIEASAGTGKTFAISGIFVRLMLEQGLSVDQILVVTFTNAATEELKIRIRSKLMEARNGLLTGQTQDPFLEALFKQNPKIGSGLHNLENGLRDFDQASIYTIHGFCQKLIQEHAFETGSHFDIALAPDPVEMLQELADDFWRTHFYPGPLEWAAAGMTRIKGPGTWLRLLMRAKRPDLKILPQIKEPELLSLEPYRKALHKLKRMWRQSRKSVAHLFADPGLSGTHYGSFKPDLTRPDWTKRDRKVDALVTAMDRLTENDPIGFPLFTDFEKFTARCLENAAKKKHRPPEHLFFDFCDDLYDIHARLNDEMDNRLLYVKTELISFAAQELPRRKKEQNVQFYDDLLNTVRNAIFSEGGRLLKQAVRRKYKAALVDEFQDTDPIQYQIFSNLFRPPNSTLFMIGDPKQAIYAFRGADVFSYMRAAGDSEKKYTLLKNYRSAPGLVTAVNTLFSNVASPFLFERIPFIEGTPNRHLKYKSDFDDPPMHLWYLRKDNGKAVIKTDAIDQITHRVKDEIISLLNDQQPAVNAKEIAVLVRTNQQARVMKACLSKHRIPAVLFSDENVFDSPEAGEMEQVLRAVGEPASEQRIRSALITDMLGYSAPDLAQLTGVPDRWDRILFRFREYHELWLHNGFVCMFRRLVEREGIKQRLLTYPGGERRLTNLFHIMEILHQESLERIRGIDSLLKWLKAQQDPETPRLEEHQLRLESDEEAVTIITMHRCKGLEYPIVFCPFGWEGSRVQKDAVFFHEAAGEQHLALDLDAASRPEHLHLAERECLAENLRLLYVALTRAKRRCYLVFGSISGSETSALAYLFHYKANAGDTDRPILSVLKQIVSTETEDDRIEDVKAVARRSRGTILFKPMPKSREAALLADEKKRTTLSHRKFTGRIPSPWEITSFSSLITSKTEDVDLPDAFLEVPVVEHPVDSNDIFAFPKGSRAGQFFHHLLETIDFQSPAALQKETILLALSAYGFSSTWEPAVATAMDHLLQTPLKGPLDPVKLSEITLENRIHEMEFHFPLKRISPDSLNRAFARSGLGNGLSSYPEKLGTLVFSPRQGFMKGFIDLVFLHNGKYFLIDWKSNFLGPDLNNYNPGALRAVMQRDHYLLQYHLYVLAFHQYLRSRIPSYCYKRDFGGVLYLFIRGIDPGQGSKCGVFYDFPDGRLIMEMGRSLIPSFDKRRLFTQKKQPSTHD